MPEQALASARGATGASQGEGWRLRKDGSRFWALVVIDAVRNDAGELIGFAKITRDISERRADGGAAARKRGAPAGVHRRTARRSCA